MATESYLNRRNELETYFDRTAAHAWAKLTSTEKLSRVRETVRAGRDHMRAVLLSWLPGDLTGQRLLDAGCGTGALAVCASQRGADVLAIDIAPTLIGIAADRLPQRPDAGRIAFRVGDMLDSAHGEFDHVVAMDSLIHYEATDMVSALATLAARTRKSIVFTFAPRTPLLSMMHALGKLFPRADRAPAIVPVAEAKLRRLIGAHQGLSGWRIDRGERVNSGFYTSQAMELVRV